MQVIHRDLKLENVLLKGEGGREGERERGERSLGGSCHHHYCYDIKPLSLLLPMQVLPAAVPRPTCLYSGILGYL